MESPTVQVVYHSPCFDGLWACVSVYLYYGEEAQYRFLPYSQSRGKEVDIEPATVTYFLDTITTEEDIARAVELSGSVVVIDHHERTRERLRPFGTGIEVVHSVDRAACVLAWDYFCLLRPLCADSVSSFLPFIQDRDLFRLELPATAEVLSGLAAIVTDQRVTCSLLRDLVRLDLQSVRETGGKHARRRTKEVEMELRKKVFAVRVGGKAEYTCYGLLTCKPHLRSEVAQELCKHSQRRFNTPLAVVAQQLPDARLRLSLRTDSEDIDVAAICELFGGGGHRKAAGMVVPQRLFWKKWVCGKQFYLPNH